MSDQPERLTDTFARSKVGQELVQFLNNRDRKMIDEDEGPFALYDAVADYRRDHPEPPYVAPERPVCTCPDWLPGIEKLNAPLMLQFARNPHTTKGYDGPQFRFCPWCGGRVRE